MQRCLIVGNGPSLNEVPVETLAKYVTFGSNRIYRKFVPDYFAWIDPLWIHHYIDDVKALDTRKYICEEHAGEVPGAIPLHTEPHRVEFSYDPLAWVYDGRTVTFVLMQLAYYFGFTEVGLVGVDNNYGYKNGPCLLKGKDDCHFIDDYYDDDVHYWKPKPHKMAESYVLAKEAYEKDGRRIVNLSPASKLDVFDFVKWEAW